MSGSAGATWPAPRAPWIPALLITAGALALEGLIFGARPDLATVQAVSESRLFWETLHSTIYLLFFALPLNARNETLPLRPLAAGFLLQIALAAGFALALGVSEHLPCLHVGDMILVVMLWPLRNGASARLAIALLAGASALVMATERHGWEDVLLGASSGLALGVALRPGTAASLRGFIARHERLATGALLAALLTACFYSTDHAMAKSFAQGAGFWSPATRWDALIPFLPAWTWPYLLYFPFCFAPLFCRRLWNDLGAFRGAACGFALQFFAAFAVFWILPSRMERPGFDVVGPTTWALSVMYRLDPGFNVFPSLHVANSTYVACLIWRWSGAAAGSAAWAACLAISLSTVLVKQHYLADLPAGALLGLAAYRLAFPPGPPSPRSGGPGGSEKERPA